MPITVYFNDGAMKPGEITEMFSHPTASGHHAAIQQAALSSKPAHTRSASFHPCPFKSKETRRGVSTWIFFGIKLLDRLTSKENEEGCMGKCPRQRVGTETVSSGTSPYNPLRFLLYNNKSFNLTLHGDPLSPSFILRLLYEA
jgi:hypothetical protein